MSSAIAAHARAGEAAGAAARVGSPIARYLAELHERCLPLRDGALADYIPELARADRDAFAICVATTDGQCSAAGDLATRFTIQSISKPFTYGVALEDAGCDAVLAKIGVEPSGEAFNSINLEAQTGWPLNPMINAGAIAAASLVAGESTPARLRRGLEVYGRCAGRPLELDAATFASERTTGHRNRAIATCCAPSGSWRRIRRRRSPSISVSAR